MKQSRLVMGMPVTVEIADKKAEEGIFNKVFDYFHYVDNKFSTYKPYSEISLINKGEITPDIYSFDMEKIFRLADETKKQTNGYFDIFYNSKFDPSGLVKGWAIYNAGKIISHEGYNNFYVEAGGDIQTSGKNHLGEDWRVGIRNPFNKKEIIKVLSISGQGIATSGVYERGNHIYNPKENIKLNEVASLTVIGPNIYEADRFATAAYVMGLKGIYFIESLSGFEGYLIDSKGTAIFTSNFSNYIKQ